MRQQLGDDQAHLSSTLFILGAFASATRLHSETRTKDGELEKRVSSLERQVAEIAST
jgi:hypothetical protein